MTVAAPVSRIESLDQFRGFTVIAMLIVNFLGGYAVCPKLLKHSHDYCSFADLVMPQFLFAAGFSMRLSFLKHVERFGVHAAWMRMLRRILGLMAVAVFWYSFTTAAQISSIVQEGSFYKLLAWLCKRGWFQTLMHIAVTSAWILPVLRARLAIRIAWTVFSAVLHLGLSSWFNFHWVNTGSLGIDGGPLGFLTWTMPMIAGTWAYDLCMTRRPPTAARTLIAFGLPAAACAWVLSSFTTVYQVSPSTTSYASAPHLAASPVLPSGDQWSSKSLRLPEPPFVPPPGPDQRLRNYWMMSQRSGTLTYLMFSAGAACIAYAVFIVMTDIAGFRISVLHTFGMNALAAYIIHDVTMTVVSAFVPETSAAGPVYVGLPAFLLLTWWIIRWLERHQIQLRM